MELDTDRLYVVLDIHPGDFFYEFREEMIGKIVGINYGRTSRVSDSEEFFYCEAEFQRPLLAESIYIKYITFHAVQLGELHAEHYIQAKPQAKAPEKRKEAEETRKQSLWQRSTY